MHKLSLAAALTAAVGGGAAVIGVTTLRGDAHAKASAPAPASQDLFAPLGPIGSSRPAAPASAHAELHDCMRSAVKKVPSLIGTGAVEPADCTAVGHHLAELQVDVVHGATGRPDETETATCAADYQAKCEAEGWSLDQRSCVLAAGDLINAHLCAAGGIASSPAATTQIPPQLACSVIGGNVARIMHAAGYHTDVADLDQQIESACDLGNWTIEIRTCLGGANSVDDLKICVAAHD